MKKRSVLIVMCIFVSIAAAATFDSEQNPTNIPSIAGHRTGHPLMEFAYAEQCCNCCYGGHVPSGEERPCHVMTTDRCRARGWVCYGYVLCPK